MTFNVDIRSMSSSPLVNSLVKIDCSRPHQTSMCRRFNLSTLWIYICCRNDAAWQPRSRNPQDWEWDLGCLEAQVGHKKVRHLLTQQFNCCTYAARCAGALSCWNTKVVTGHCVSLAAVWSWGSSIMTSWSSIEEVSKWYHQNFLLCNNNEITACIADWFYSFCEEVYAVAFSR